MDEQSRPVEPQDGQDTDDAGRNTGEAQGAGAPPAGQHAKARGGYLDPRGSESTRELRDTARRRRDAEEKLQQHLLEAKDHIPNEFHEHGHAEHGYSGHTQAEHGNARPGHDKHGHADQSQPEEGEQARDS